MKTLKISSLILILVSFINICNSQTIIPAFHTINTASCDGTGGSVSLISDFEFEYSSNGQTISIPYDPQNISPTYHNQVVWLIGQKANGISYEGLRETGSSPEIYQFPASYFFSGATIIIDIPHDVVSIIVCMEQSPSSYSVLTKGNQINTYSSINTNNFRLNIWNHHSNFSVYQNNITNCAPLNFVTLSSSYDAPWPANSNFHYNSALSGAGVIWSDGTINISTNTSVTVSTTSTTTYTATFTADGGDCAVSKPITHSIIENPIINLTNNTGCNGSPANLTVDLVKYSNWVWSTNKISLWNSTGWILDASGISNGNEATFNNVPSGAYSLVIDRPNCSGYIKPITISSGNSPNVSPNIVNAICYGNLSSIYLNVTDPNYQNFTYSWSDGNSILPITGYNAINIGSGIFSVTVTSTIGCETAITNMVTTNPPSTPISINNIVHQKPSCLNSSNGNIAIFVNSTSGTPPHTITWSNGASGFIYNISAGLYSYTITDANNCALNGSFNLVNENYPNSFTSIINNASCFGVSDGEVILSPTFGTTSDYDFSWSNGSNSESTIGSSGTYTVTITSLNPSNPNIQANCSFVQQYVIANSQSQWHKTTQNTTGQNDNIKRILTDADGNVYALGEYVEETVLDGEVLNAGGGSGQDGIFLAKYNNCGKLLWYVNSNSIGASYDLEAIDIAFSGPNDIIIYGKWDDGNNGNNVEMQNSVGGVPFPVSGSSTEEVFSFIIDKASASITNSQKHKLLFNDDITRVLNDGTNNYFAGRFDFSGTNTAAVNTGAMNTSSLSIVFEDDNAGVGNVITGMTMGANGDIYAIANLQSDADFDNGTTSPVLPNIIVPSGVNEGAVLKYSATTSRVTAQSNAKATNINLTDVVYNSATQNVWITSQFEDQIQNWNPNMVSGIQTGLIASFEPDLTPINQYYLDPNSGISVSSANALSISGSDVYVAGTFTGSFIDLGLFNNPQVHSNYAGSGNTNDLWMAKYDATAGTFVWAEGSNSPNDVTVNDIAFNGTNAYIGGSYSMDMYLPNVSLLHPLGGSGIELGYIVRGGDFSTGGGQGEFYKTDNTNTSEATDVFENNTNIVVYPNPNNGTFTLRLVGEYTGETHLIIFDVTGRVVYQQTAQKASETTEFSLSPQGLSKGIYMIAVEQNGLTEYQKFVIE